MASISNLDCYVLGGYEDLENLSPSNAGAFQALGGQLYTHGSAISDAAADNTLPQLAAVWNQFGGGVLEAGENSFFAPGDAYDTFCKPYGYVPQQINLNVGAANAFQAPQLAAAEAWMDNARSRPELAGISIAPFATPSGEDDAANPIDGEHPFTTTDSFWGALASACVYGGGIAIDIPANNFLTLGNGWPQFLESQIRWGNSVGIRTSVVLSPTDNDFQAEVQQVVARLVADNAIPSQWCVENYTPAAGTTTIALPDASDSTPNTLNAAALWLIQNAPVTTAALGVVYPTGSLLGSSTDSLTAAVSLARSVATVAVASGLSDSTTAADSGSSSPGTYAASSGVATTTTSQGAALVTDSSAGNTVIYSLGNDTVVTGDGWDTVFASGSAASVTGGSGHLLFVAGAGSYSVSGGLGSATLYGGSGSATLQGGAAGSNVLVAGTGNATLVSANGDLMFGGAGETRFVGSAAGGDIMVGGTGQNTFVLAGGGVAFGGGTLDSFEAGSGGAILVEGAGESEVAFGSGAATAFAGTGSDTFTVTAGEGGRDGIVGFKATDSLVLQGYGSGEAARALGSATTGAFGTSLSLPDGTSLTLWGVQDLQGTQLVTG